MKLPERPSLSMLIAESLEIEIRKGSYKDQLPGYRTLSKLLNVSPRTIHAALEILTRRKIILPPEGKRARNIHPNITFNIDENLHNNRSILILTSTPFQTQDISIRRALDAVIKLFTRKKWSIDYETCADINNEKSDLAMEHLFAPYKNHRWILTRPTRTAIKWCKQHQLRFICFGGDTINIDTPSIAVSTSTMLDHAVGVLSDFGHSRICILSNLLSAKSQNIILKNMEASFSSRGIKFHPIYNLPKIGNHDYQNLWRCLNDIFSLSPPSAIIATEAHQLITIYSYCLQNRLRIPEDLSVVVTQESSHLEWFHPRPANFEFPIDQFAKTISRWVENYPTQPISPIKIMPKFIHGESIGPAKL